jgi:hypothetical protein
VDHDDDTLLVSSCHAASFKLLEENKDEDDDDDDGDDEDDWTLSKGKKASTIAIGKKLQHSSEQVNETAVTEILMVLYVCWLVGWTEKTV